MISRALKTRLSRRSEQRTGEHDVRVLTETVKDAHGVDVYDDMIQRRGRGKTARMTRLVAALAVLCCVSQ